MASDHLDHDHAQADIESDAGSDVASHHDPSEDTPLLANDLPSEFAPPKSLQRRVLFVGFLCLTATLSAQYIMEPALQKILEDNICRGYHPDHLLTEPQVQDQRCKGADVQTTLAMLRSWGASMDMAICELSWGSSTS